MAGSTKDITYTYARNQAQEIVRQSGNNTAYSWRPGFDRQRGDTVNGLNQYRQYGSTRFSDDTAGNLIGDGNWIGATTPTTG